MLTPRSQFSQTLILLYTTLYDMSRSGGVFTRFLHKRVPPCLCFLTRFFHENVFFCARQSTPKRRSILLKSIYAGGGKSFCFRRCMFTKKLLCAKPYADRQLHTSKGQRRIAGTARLSDVVLFGLSITPKRCLLPSGCSACGYVIPKAI